MNRKILCCLVLSMALLTGGAHSDGPAPSDRSDLRTAVYVSEKGETLTATFDLTNDTVLVKLLDGNSVTLPRALSASGARYSDGRYVFWEHHGEGTFWEGEEILFQGKAN